MKAMEVSVLQWNVWYEESIERVLAFLRTHPTDIICLQELTKGYMQQTHENTWEYLAKNLEHTYHVQEVPIVTPATQWSQANAILSKFPISDTRSEWINEPVEGDDYDDQYRSYIEVKVRIGKKELAIGTTHMSYAEGAAAASRKEQEIRRLLDVIDTKRQAYILTGDFNAVPDSYTVREVEKRLLHVGPSYKHNTWTTKPHDFGNAVIDALDWRYDYIFATKDMQVISSEIVSTDVSDHLPVRAVLKI
jgi:endonuclease/exonuclease/phosphatase family metal-dependent hydrolase